MVLPADPADSVVLRLVVWPTAIVVDVALTVTVRRVLPVVNDKIFP